MNMQEVRESRNKAVVVYSKFIQYRDKFSHHVFCFYEGEDIKYYEQRIELYANVSYKKLVGYNCGGKKEVLKLKKMIMKDNYESVKKMFIIDRDYLKSDFEDSEIYETPCYSVENFYTSKNAFEKILKREFSLNVIDVDFCKCINEYTSRQEEFHDKLLFLNAWLACQRKYEIENGKRNVDLKDFKITKYFDKISIDEIRVKQTIDECLLHTLFPNANPVKEEDITNSILLLSSSDRQKDFRGKFELEFLKKIIDDLKQKNKDCNYMLEFKECVKIDPNVDTLSSLSQFADTPPCLINFLQKYKEAT